MAKTFVWAGQAFTSVVGQTENQTGARLEDITTKADRLKCHWNNPANWFEIVPSSGFIQEDTYITGGVCPGGDDTVKFERFTHEDVTYPLSPCLYGGYWGDEGWLNASSTGGRLAELSITDKWGISSPDTLTETETTSGVVTGITEPPTDEPWSSDGVKVSTYRIGTFPTERALLVSGASSDAFGYQFTGASMSGLRVLCRNFKTTQGNGKASYTSFVNIDTISCFINDDGYSWFDFFGGTANQMMLQGKPLLGPPPSTNPAQRTNATIRFRFIHDQDYNHRANVTGYAYIGDVCPTFERAYVASPECSVVLLDSDYSMTSLVVDQSIRPKLARYAVNVDTAIVYPEYAERDKVSLFRYGFQSVLIGVPEGYAGQSATCDIGTLKIVNHPSDETRKSLPLGGFLPYREQVDYLALSDVKLCGSNNMVGVQGRTVVGDLQNLGGRFVLGYRTNYFMPPVGPGSPEPQESAYLSGGLNAPPIQITKGIVNKNCIVDLRHPTTPLWRDIRLGTGVSLPSEENVGLKYAADDAFIFLPIDGKLVMDYESDASDGTDVEIGSLETYEEADVSVIIRPPTDSSTFPI